MILIWEGYMGKLWEGECNSLGPFVSGMSTYKKQQYNIVIQEVNTKETEQGSGLLIFTTNLVESFGSLTICLYEFDKNKDLKQKSLPLFHQKLKPKPGFIPEIMMLGHLFLDLMFNTTLICLSSTIIMFIVKNLENLPFLRSLLILMLLFKFLQVIFITFNIILESSLLVPPTLGSFYWLPI